MQIPPATSEPCKYMEGGACTNSLALPVYGAQPSAAVCAQCEFRNGLRGLGDAVAVVTTAFGIRPCGGCKERQSALNAAVPFPKKRKCNCPEKSANAG
jgi:hypothetical protein